ncbi:MAG: hypothetical protein Q9167_001646 [Letrouitia subvulpina]
MEYSIKEGPTPLNSLPYLPKNNYCQDHVLGKCRLDDQCRYPHEIGQVPVGFAFSGKGPAFENAMNTLLSEPQSRPIIASLFHSDGPGKLAKLGPRHNNDHEEIENIRILPTTDEILSKRSPHLPLKNADYANDRLHGKARLIDAQFRHLRYDSIESIRDVCYHAAQDLAKTDAKPCAADYDVRQITPQGNQYSLFRNVRWEDLAFDRNGIQIRMSFNCPKSLRSRLLSAGHFEKGMLAALIGLNEEHHLSVTYFNIDFGQGTESMRPITGNHDKASVWLTFAEPSDTDTIRKLLYSFQGLSSPESFLLVEFPKLLYAGFSWALKHLQNLKSKDTAIAFSELIAPSHLSSRREIPAPQYTQSEHFAFNLSVIQNKKPSHGFFTAKFNPQQTAQCPESTENLVETVKSTTTLDDGQAVALCNSLLRSFSFVKGPPGTGKSYLGTALAQVILNANPTQPILVVSQTNQALDGFIEDLTHKGITEVARLGQGSKKDWTAKYNIHTIRDQAKKVREEQRLMSEARKGMEGLRREGIGWCDALTKGGLTWNAVKSFFKKQYPEIFKSFHSIKSPHSEILDDLHRARSGDGGYAFEYWCTGGDINDIEGFREYIKSLLDTCSPPSDSSTSESSLSANSQIRSVNSHAKSIHESVHQDVWAQSLAEREKLIAKWKAELGCYTTVDKLVEVQRRFCVVKDMQRQAQLITDARLIKDKQIIGMTTTACAQEWSMLEGLNLSTVICEEAGEITEAQTLTMLLPSIKHAMFIGDPDQLRPQLKQPSLSMATETGKLYRLDESLFERMVSPSSSEVKALPYSILTVQRRMHPDIADLMRATIYPSLKDHASTARPSVAGMVHRTFWFDHQYPEDCLDKGALDSTSYSNTFECDMICELVRHLLKTNDFGVGDITILCPYNKQLENVQKKLAEAAKCSIFLSDADKESLVGKRALPEEELRSRSKSSIDLASMVRFASVDGFQGQEAKVIILSAVRSNPHERTGFLSITNRINVACSRARDGFYILGNSKVLKTVAMWRTIIDDFERKGRLGTREPVRLYSKPLSYHAVTLWREPAPNRINLQSAKIDAASDSIADINAAASVQNANLVTLMPSAQPFVAKSWTVIILVPPNATRGRAHLVRRLARGPANTVLALTFAV